MPPSHVIAAWHTTLKSEVEAAHPRLVRIDASMSEPRERERQTALLARNVQRWVAMHCPQVAARARVSRAVATDLPHIHVSWLNAFTPRPYSGEAVSRVCERFSVQALDVVPFDAFIAMRGLSPYYTLSPEQRAVLDDRLFREVFGAVGLLLCLPRDPTPSECRAHAAQIARGLRSNISSGKMHPASAPRSRL